MTSQQQPVEEFTAKQRLALSRQALALAVHEPEGRLVARGDSALLEAARLKTRSGPVAAGRTLS